MFTENIDSLYLPIIVLIEDKAIRPYIVNHGNWIFKMYNKLVVAPGFQYKFKHLYVKFFNYYEK